MPPKFGTSGLRGLVTELTPDLVASYVRAFVAACPQGSYFRDMSVCVSMHYRVAFSHMPRREAE